MRRISLASLFYLNKQDLYGEKYGCGIILAGGNAGIGRYQMA